VPRAVRCCCRTQTSDDTLEGWTGCVVTNDMRSSSRTWTDPQSDRSRCGDVRPQRSGPGVVQTENSALSQYAYFLDDVYD
jgi:hypothetical protein